MSAALNLPPAELAELVRQVDDQLNALQTVTAARIRIRGAPSGECAELPGAPEQQAVIERATGEPFETFWQKYKRHARRDLCLPGGLLHEQWRKWRDLQSTDAVKMSLAALAGMGISTANIPVLAVAATVFLLNVVGKIGIEAVCEGCAEEQLQHATPPAPSDTQSSPELEVSIPAAAAPEENAEPPAESPPQARVVSFTGAANGSPLFTVWYGTNRQPVDAADHSKGYTGSRGSTISHGTCHVAVPRSHEFGSVGSPFWKRWLTLNDDRLRLTANRTRWRKPAGRMISPFTVDSATVQMYGYTPWNTGGNCRRV